MSEGLGKNVEERISGAKLNAATYHVHGLVTKVYADNILLALAVQDFLRSFRGLPSGKADIEFYLLTVDPGYELDPGGSNGNKELLYDWNVFRYSREGSLRYQQVPGGGWIVADLDKGLAVAFIEREVASNSWSIAHVMFYPIWAQMLKAQGIFPIHAAGLERGGHGVLFPGKSNCGKSTLSLRLLKRGYKFLGDDTIFVKQSGEEVEMLFFPEEVNICEEAVDLFSPLMHTQSNVEDRWQPKASVNLNEIGANSIVESSRAEFLIFPVIAEDGKTSYEPVNPRDALAELVLYAFLFMDPQTSKENFAVLASLVQSVKSYRLYMGLDGDDIAAAVDEIIAAA